MQTAAASPLNGQERLTQALRSIALRARTLDERLQDALQRNASQRRADAFSEHGLRRWRQAAGGEDKLRRRLAADGYDEDDARRALGSPAVPQSQTFSNDYLPAWPQRLGDVLASADAMTPTERFRKDALHRLGPCTALTPPALAALEARLVNNLKALMAPPLEAAEDSCDLVDLFREYSVLARHLIRVCDTWVDAVRELDERLAADREMLGTEFGIRGDLVGLRAGLSDRHGGGRQVCELMFALPGEPSASVMYKPRSLDAEAAFQDVLEDLSSDLSEQTPPRLKVCLRGDYGWMQTAHHAPLADGQQARLAFQRAGSLLCLTWLLGANDLHMGNVIASAEGPVVVDLETLLQDAPHVGSQGEESALGQARQRLDGSFLGTGLLSLPRRDADDRFFDIGGLLGDGEHNRFRLDGNILRPEDFGDELMEGFERTFRAVSRPGAVDRIAGRFRNVRPRRVLRSSQGYAYLLGRLTSLDGLRDGFSAGLLLESLTGDPDDVRAEKASLQGLDIPAFDSDPDPGIEAMQRRCRGLDEAALGQQLEILRASLGRSGRPAQVVTAMAVSAEPSNRASSAESPTDIELSTALDFARRLQERAIVGADGSATWLTAGSVRIAGRQDRGMSYHLYDGGVGIAVFLAALARVTGDGTWAGLARAALRPIEGVLESPRRSELVRRERLGAGSGLGSIVYGTTLIAQFLGDDGILETARRTARLITPERIATDDRFDIEGGSAGALLGLRALYRVAPESWMRHSMEVCGEHLLDHLNASAETIQPGFAHGASGLAYAFLALSEATETPRWIAAARNASLLERPAYDVKKKNWRSVDGTVRNAWCHGAPGIALARAAAHGRIDEPWVEQELRLALGTTLRGAKVSLEAPAVEHLCCGRFGRVDMLLEAGRRFDRSDLVGAARAVARQRLQAAVRFAEEDHPGFFRGISGLGYTLLRLRDAVGIARLPSVLAFETMESPS